MPKQCSIIVQSLGSGAKQTRSKFWSCCLLADDQAAQVVKNPPAHAERQGTQARPLGQEGPLAEGTAPHSSVPACRVPRTEEPGGLQSTGSQVDMTECAHTHTHTHTPSTTASKGG